MAHDGNLTRTAARLNLSQSALSAQIRKLEDALGHDLFERRGRTLQLTEVGRIALDHADAIFKTGDELLGTLGERASANRQVIRIGALATLSRNFQAQFVRPILERDDVAISVRSGRLSDLLQSLESHGLDVVLTNDLPSRDAINPWIPHRIAEQSVSLVGHPGRLRPDDTPSVLLRREPVLAPTAETSLRMNFDAYVERMGIQPRFAAEVDDMAMLRVLTRENIGIAVVPPIVVTDELASGQLIEAQQIPELKEVFYAVTLRRRFPNPLLNELLGAASED